MFKKVFLFFSALFFLFFQTTPVSAESNFNSLVIPIRELTDSSEDSLELPKLIYQTATSSAQSVTWLLDYDALTSATTSAFFQQIHNSTQEIGLIIDIPPLLYHS